MLSQRALSELEAKGNKKVLVQLPEGLKPKALDICKELAAAGFSPIISGDPCFGACDLRFEKDATTLHIAHAPITSDDRVVFEEWPHGIHLGKAVDAALPLLPNTVCIATTVQHVRELGEAIKILRDTGKSAFPIPKGDRCAYEGQVLGCDFSGAKGVECDAFLFIGSGRFHPIGLAYYTKKRVIRADPFTGEAEELNADQWLKDKALRMTKANGAKRFGVIVSSKPGQRNDLEAKNIVGKLRAKGFEACVIVMDLITPDSLVQLALDAYVITACPRLVIDDWKNYSMPVLLADEI